MIVTGPKFLHDEVARYLEQLDVDPQRTLMENAFRPRHVSANALLQTISPLFAGEQGSRFSLDATGQAMIARAPRVCFGESRGAGQEPRRRRGGFAGGAAQALWNEVRQRRLRGRFIADLVSFGPNPRGGSPTSRTRTR